MPTNSGIKIIIVGFGNLQSFTVRILGDFSSFLSALASNTAFITNRTLPNYFLKINVIMTLSLGPPPPPPLSVMAKVADSHTWT